MISFEETVQTVISLVKENEQLRAQVKELTEQLKEIGITPKN